MTMSRKGQTVKDEERFCSRKKDRSTCDLFMCVCVSVKSCNWVNSVESIKSTAQSSLMSWKLIMIDQKHSR